MHHCRVHGGSGVPVANLPPVMTRLVHASPPRSRRGRSGAQSRWALLGSVLPASLRGAALMPAAALAVHQLRYSLAFGDGATQELAAQGHAYLTSLVPWIVLLATLSLGASLGGLARRWASGPSNERASRRVGLRVWAAAAFVLVTIYTGQELLEGTLASGHAAGLAGVFGGGGWWAIPAALLVGGILALALRGAHAVEDALADGRPALRVRLGALTGALLQLAQTPFVAVPAPLARAAAGRAPPRSPAATLA